jgi:glycosyltransferase involved in cell wall biosynthesis
MASPRFAPVKISIVVPAFNEEKLITASLRTIQSASQAFTEAGWQTELIVCDNNSSDRTGKLAQQAGAKVVFEPVNQISRARNSGARAADGDWLVFVDADSHPSKELFAEVADRIRGGDCLGGGCTIQINERHWPAEFITGLWNLISRMRRWAAGSFVYCETAAFRQAGGFSQELFASEEIDLSQRLKELARARGQRFEILHHHPILTSARKIHLYSGGEYLRFFARVIFRPGETLRNRDACQAWYDGRR